MGDRAVTLHNQLPQPITPDRAVAGGSTTGATTSELARLPRSDILSAGPYLARTVMTTVDKKHVVALVERLDPEQAIAAVRFMEFLLLDPAVRGTTTALPDDEPVTEEDGRRIERGKDHAAFDGRSSNMDDVLAEFNVSPKDFPARP